MDLNLQRAPGVSRFAANRAAISYAYKGRCSLTMLAVGLVMSWHTDGAHAQGVPVGQQLTSSQLPSGEWISWVEHVIDSPEIAGFDLSGSDGLVLGDVDGDGHEDILSVHESDSEYDSSVFDPNYVPDAQGHVRLALRRGSEASWHSITLAEGAESPAPEDVAVGDLNGDGFLDVVVAAELSHLLYLQNPGPGRAQDSEAWQRLIIPMTRNKGSYIRVFISDLDDDGLPEVIAANKGAQRPGPEDFARSTPVSLFQAQGDPLNPDSWIEVVLGRYSVPQNAQPVDLDGDGDSDLVVGTRGENRLAWLENRSERGSFDFHEHAIGIVGAAAAGFNLDYADINGDGRLDILAAVGTETLPATAAWLEQPASIDDAWLSHPIGTIAPDVIAGLTAADIDGDGDTDLLVGSYSRGPREEDGVVTPQDALGRLAWFENFAIGDNRWQRHDISRRKRGMFDKFIARDIDGDGDLDFFGTRGNSAPFDGVFWLEQQRSSLRGPSFIPAEAKDSAEMPLPNP